MGYDVKILADSITERGDRITTMEVTFPRFVLSEFNTHRMFSRNSASSRAIPVSKIIDRVNNDPALPVWWGKYQKGMSASVELPEPAREEAKRLWLQARDKAVQYAIDLKDMGGVDEGVHKQVTNRLLEPWMWQTCIVTATEWSNFYALRISKHAQPEIKVVATMMRDAQNSSTPSLLTDDQWHLPLVREEDRLAALSSDDPDFLLKLSTARCARVSYLTHDGKRDLEADVSLHDTLVSSGHMSPCEHPARPMTDGEYAENDAFCGNFKGWIQYRKQLVNESDYGLWESDLQVHQG